MKYLDGQCYVEVKDHRYRIHPTENIILRLRDPPRALRTQYQAQNDIQIRMIQKVTRNDNNELIVRNHPRNKQPTQQQPNCPSCKRNIWLEFDEG